MIGVWLARPDGKPKGTAVHLVRPTSLPWGPYCHNLGQLAPDGFGTWWADSGPGAIPRRVAYSTLASSPQLPVCGACLRRYRWEDQELWFHLADRGQVVD